MTNNERRSRNKFRMTKYRFLPMSMKKIIRHELFTPKSITIIGAIAFFYIIISIYVLNFRFLWQIYRGDFPLSFKAFLLLNLLSGLWTSFSTFDIFLLVITAFLVGLNFYLAGKSLRRLENNGKVNFSIGGAAMVGFVSTGCMSCGFSLLSILGLSASVSFLPFHGLELHVLAIILLCISSVYMIKELHKAKYCKVQKK